MIEEMYMNRTLTMGASISGQRIQTNKSEKKSNFKQNYVC